MIKILKHKKLARQKLQKICNNILLTYTDGATIFEADGIYKHKNGKITIEKTLRIELLFLNDEIIKDIVLKLKEAFNQESILLQEQEIKSDFI